MKFLRFLKIFLISFCSVVGVMGLAVGISYLAGGFNTPKIEPEDLIISLKEEEVNAYVHSSEDNKITIYTGGDFYVTISTSTEDCTMKDLKLSFENSSTPAVSGKISDGVITIPNQVKIGTPFKVELVKTSQTFNLSPAITLDWVKGGISKIIAKSVSNITLLPFEIEVAVDVPVYAVELEAYPAVDGAEPQSSFAVGSLFDIKAKFYPDSSKFRFSQKDNEETLEDEALYKTLYLSQNVTDVQYYERNEGVSNYNNQFVSKKIGDVSIDGYVLTNSMTEYYLEKAYKDANLVNQTYSDNQIYENIRNGLISSPTNDRLKDTLNIGFERISEYSYSVTSQTKQIKESTQFTYFANYDSNVNGGNLGIVFNSNNQDISMQTEVINVGISVVKKVEDNKVSYDAKFNEYSDKKYLAYQLEGSNTYISPIEFNELIDLQKVNYIPSVLNSLDGVDASISPVYMEFYLPKVSNSNVNASLWQLSIDDIGDYSFITYYFGQDGQEKIELPLYYVDFSIAGGVTSPVRWLNTSEKELVVLYDDEGKNERIVEYDVKKYGTASNVFVPATNEYTSVKYFVYSDYAFVDGDDISKYIVCQPAGIDNENFSSVNLYEIEDGIIKFISGKEKAAINKTFNVIFATVKTYANGEIRYNNGKYVVDQISSNETGSYVESIPFSVVDSLFDITGTIEILKEDKAVAPVVAKNEDGEELKKLAFKQNTEEVFKVTIDTSSETTLLEEELHSNGQISIIAKSLSGVNLILEDFLIQYVDGREITFSTRPISADKIAFNLYIKYDRTDKLYLVNSFVFAQEEDDAQYLEVYSGDAKTGYFGSYKQKQDGSDLTEEDTAPSLAEVLGEGEDVKTVKVEVEISSGEGNNTVLETTYTVETLVEDNLVFVDTAIFGDDQKIKVGFKDEYGFDVNDVSHTLESSNEEVLKIQNGKLVFISAGDATLYLKINDEVVDRLNFTYKESPVVLYNLDKLQEKSEPEMNAFDNVNVYNLVTDEGEAYEYNELTIELLGAKGREIDFSTVKLLSLGYAQLNPDYDETIHNPTDRYLIYDLSSNITYSLLSNVSADADLLAMISLKYSENELTGLAINEHFARDARIRIEANIPEINFIQVISLVIRPNITVGVQETLAQLPNDINPEDYINTATSEVFKGVFGKTSFGFTITTSYVIEAASADDKAQVEIVDYTGRQVEGELKGDQLVVATAFEDVYSFKTVTYRVYIGVQTQSVNDQGEPTQTNYNAYSFNQNMNYYINPNIKLVSNSSHVDKDGVDIFVDGGVLEIKRIVGSDEFTSSSLYLKQLKDGIIYDIQDNECDFIFDNNKLTLKNNSIDSPVNLNVLVYIQKTGEEKQHNIVVGASEFEIENIFGGMDTYYYKDITILPRIVVNDASTRIIEYNGKQYFYLVEGETISKAEILSNFDMYEGDTLSPDNDSVDLLPLQSGIWSKTQDDTGYTISTNNRISGINGEFSLILDSEDYYLTYPVLVIPFNYPIFADSIGYEKQGSEFKISDAKNLLDINYLKANDLYLNINLQSGTKIRLDKIFNSYIAGSYSEENLTYTNGVFTSFFVTNADATDSNQYAYCIKENDGMYLYTNLIGVDKEIILTARKGEAGANVFEIPVRIRIISNVELKVFYPYGDVNSGTEYVTFDVSDELKIDMNEIQGLNIPNRSSDGKRFELFVAGESAVNNDNITEDINISYSVKNVNIGSGYAKNLSDYAKFNGSVLTLYNYKKQNAFIVTIEIIVGNNVCKKDYVITVIDDSEKYSLITTNLTLSNGTFDSDEGFKVDYTEKTEISGFTLRKQVGSVYTVVNSELKYYIYNGLDTAIDSENTKAGKVTILNYDTIVDIKARLLVYTLKGKIAEFDYYIKSTHSIKLNGDNDLQSNTSYSFLEKTSTLTLTDATLGSFDILSLSISALKVGTTDVVCEDEEAFYTNKNGTTSFVQVDNLTKSLVISPFMLDAKVTLLVKFEYESVEYELSYEKVIKKDLSSLSADASNPKLIKNASNLDFNGGDIYSLNLNDVFEGNNQSYNITYTALQGVGLVKLPAENNGTQLTFANTSIGGEVIIKVIATHKVDENYYLESYIKFVVGANLKLTINYPNVNGESQNSEVIAQDYEIKLSETGVLCNEEERVILTTNSDAPLSYTIKVKSTQYVNMHIGASEESVLSAQSSDALRFVLQSGRTSGQINLGLYVNEDEVGSYLIYVRGSWQDIIRGNLKNEDNSLNNVSNPETFFNGARLDVADLLTEDGKDDEEKLKQFVFGYNSETDEYLDKSSFNYYVNIASSTLIPNTFFECSIDNEDEDVTIGENSDKNIIITIKTKSGIEVGKYYVKFIFSVVFDDEVITLYPKTFGDIKTLYNITYNEKYTLDVKKDEDGNYDLKVYTKNEENPLIWDENEAEEYLGSKYKNFLTFEQNGTNIEAHGAPNSGIKIDFTIVISCGQNKVEKPLSCIVLPNYVVEIIEEQPFVINAENYTVDIIDLVLATNDVVSSSIVVTRENDETVKNLLADSSLWTASVEGLNESETDFNISNITNEFGVLKATILLKGSAIRNIVIEFVDSFDYKFTFTIKYIPKTKDIVKFTSANYSVDELSTFVVDNSKVNINEGTDKFINFTFTNMQGQVQTLSNSSINDEKTQIALTMPAVTQSTSYVLNVKILRKNALDSSEENIKISTNIIVRSRYDLVVDNSYLTEGVLYLRDEQAFNVYDYFNVTDSAYGLSYGKRSLKDTLSFNLKFKDEELQSIGQEIFIYQVPKADMNNNSYDLFPIKKAFEHVIECKEEINGESTTLSWAGLNLSTQKFEINFNEYAKDVTEPELQRYYLTASYNGKTVHEVINYSQIKANDGKIVFDKPIDLEDKKGNSITFTVEYCNASYNISNITLGEDYAVSIKNNKATEFYIPLSELLFDEKTAKDYYYYYSTDINSSEISKFVNGGDAGFLIEDKALTIEIANTSENIEITMFNINDGGEIVPKILTIPQQDKPVKLSYSLRIKLGKEYSDDLQLLDGKYDGKNYYRGITYDNLLKIKKIQTSETEEESTKTVDITKAEDGTVWLDDSIRPLYAVGSFTYEKIELVNGKDFGGRVVSFRALPRVVNIANNSGIVDKDGNDSRIVKTIRTTADGSEIEFKDWADDVYMMTENDFIYNEKHLPQSLIDYKKLLDDEKTGNVYSFKFTILDSDCASIDEETGDLTPDATFDYIHGHITIEIYMIKTDSNGEEVYTVKIGYVRVMPRELAEIN